MVVLHIPYGSPSLCPLWRERRPRRRCSAAPAPVAREGEGGERGEEVGGERGGGERGGGREGGGGWRGGGD